MVVSAAIFYKKPMIIIPSKPDPSDTAGLDTYNKYLAQIRFAIWDDIDSEQLSDEQIDNVSTLWRAEQKIIELSGRTSLTAQEFTDLSDTVEKNKMISGVILQTALYLLHSFPQLKRAQMTELQTEFYQDTTKEEFLEKQIQDLFPTAVVAGQAIPDGGGIIEWTIAEV